MRAAAEGFPSAWARLSSLAWSLSWARLGWDGRDRVGMTLLSHSPVVRLRAERSVIGLYLARQAGLGPFPRTGSALRARCLDWGAGRAASREAEWAREEPPAPPLYWRNRGADPARYPRGLAGAGCRIRLAPTAHLPPTRSNFPCWRSL